MKFFCPVLPSPRYLPVSEILSDDLGNPFIANPSFLLDCRLPETEVQKHYGSLWRYLQEGRERGVADRYLCQHRSPWYAQEKRPAPPFICTYLGRGDVKSGRPFRFILNHSRATVTNVYLALYPERAVAQAIEGSPSLARRIWEILNCIEAESMLTQGGFMAVACTNLSPRNWRESRLMSLLLFFLG